MIGDKTMKKVLLLMGLFIFTSCTMPTAMLYTDNKACTKSLVDGAMNIALNDMDANETVRNKYFGSEKKYLNLLNNKEFSSFRITSDETGERRTYFYYIKKEGNDCFIKLYRKKVNRTYNSDTLLNIPFMTLDSYKLNLCNCSENNVKVGL